MPEVPGRSLLRGLYHQRSALGSRGLGLTRLMLGFMASLGSVPWLPLLMVFFAVRVLLARAYLPLGSYDEGLLFTDAYLLRRGAVMYRDFHFCYPPGVVQLVRAVLALHLPAIWTVRLLALLVRLASAA